MISNIGNILQWLTVFFGIASILSSIFKYGYLQQVFYTNCCCIVLSFILFVCAFIFSDFSLQSVFLHSSTMSPFIFKVGATWVTNEGSLLLWLSLLTIVSFFYIRAAYKQQLLLYTQICIIATVQLLFMILIYITSHPFMSSSFTPNEGIGLNPLLQDIALVIHPPILYLGSVCYIVPFATAMIILFNDEYFLYKKATMVRLLQLVKPISTLGISCLTLGIGLGSWWAYRELGWGGYWFFDPVENISLLPWLIAISLHHSLNISIKHIVLIRWTVVLSILSFIMVIFSMFLIRSGLLHSLHTFISPLEMVISLLIVFALIAVPSLCILILKAGKLKKLNNPIQKTIYYQVIGINISNAVWIFSAIILTFATVYPILYQFIYKVQIVVTEKFFVYSFVPIAICGVFISAIFSSYYNFKQYFITLTLTVLITIISAYQMQYTLISLCGAFCGIFLILQMLHLILIKSDYFKHAISVKNMSMILSHVGFGLLTVSITWNTLLQTEHEFIGTIGDQVHSEKFDISLHDIKFTTGSNYHTQIAELWITDRINKNVMILRPENRLYIIEKAITQDSDIYSYLTHDMYAIINTIEDDVVHAKIYYRPLISFIWLSIATMVSGFSLRIFLS